MGGGCLRDVVAHSGSTVSDEMLIMIMDPTTLKHYVHVHAFVSLSKGWHR